MSIKYIYSKHFFYISRKLNLLNSIYFITLCIRSVWRSNDNSVIDSTLWINEGGGGESIFLLNFKTNHRDTFINFSIQCSIGWTDEWTIYNTYINKYLLLYGENSKIKSLKNTKSMQSQTHIDFNSVFFNVHLIQAPDIFIYHFILDDFYISLNTIAQHQHIAVVEFQFNL